MAKQNETGHAINVANFEDLISFCEGHAQIYNPNKESIKLSALQARFQQAKNANETVNLAMPANTTAINERDILFKPVKKLVTRIPYAVKASGTSSNTVADVKTIVRKLQGRRAIPVEGNNPGEPEHERENRHSVSQLSYDSQVEHLDKLVKLLSAIPGYKPNETDLSVASLSTLHSEMKIANSRVINSFTPLSNARISRNTELYHPDSGLLAIVNDVKAYLKSVFTIKSQQYRQVSRLRFHNTGL